MCKRLVVVKQRLEICSFDDTAAAVAHRQRFSAARSVVNQRHFPEAVPHRKNSYGLVPESWNMIAYLNFTFVDEQESVARTTFREDHLTSFKPNLCCEIDESTQQFSTQSAE